MVPNSEDGGASSGNEQTPKPRKSKGAGSKVAMSVEKDSEEYRKLRERNNEAVKKSRTRTRLRTQTTLDKVEKLRVENSKLEDRIESLKKELELLKELFVSHAGTKSMKRLTEVDLDVLLAEAAPNSRKNKKNTVPYTGRNRELIEREVLALLGQPAPEPEVDEALPSTSREAELLDSASEMHLPEEGQQTMDESSAAIVAVDEGVDQAEGVPIDAVEGVEGHLEQMEQDIGEVTETYTIIDDGSGPTVWTTENGEAVVVTIEGDIPVQQDLHDIIQGEILMLE